MSNTSQRSEFVAAPSQAATPKPATQAKPTYSIAMHKGFGLHVTSSDGTSLKACPAFSVKGCVVDANGQNPAYLMCFETLLGGEATEAIRTTASKRMHCSAKTSLSSLMKWGKPERASLQP